jgi:hypothetical protein
VACRRSLQDEGIGIDVVADEKRTVVLYMPDELFGAISADKLSVIRERNKRSFAGMPPNLEILEIGLSYITQLSMNSTYESVEISFRRDLPKPIVRLCVDGVKLLGINLGMKLSHGRLGDGLIVT